MCPKSKNDVNWRMTVSGLVVSVTWPCFYDGRLLGLVGLDIHAADMMEGVTYYNSLIRTRMCSWSITEVRIALSHLCRVYHKLIYALFTWKRKFLVTSNFACLGYTIMHPDLKRPMLVDKQPMYTDISHFEDDPEFEEIRDALLRWVQGVIYCLI